MAGSWGGMIFRKGFIDNAYNRPVGVKADFTAGGDGSVPSFLYNDQSGFISCVDVVFGPIPPSSVIVDLRTVDNVSLPGFPAEPKTESGRIELDSPVPFSGGVIAVITGNTNPYAQGSVILQVF